MALYFSGYTSFDRAYSAAVSSGDSQNSFSCWYYLDSYNSAQFPRLMEKANDGQLVFNGTYSGNLSYSGNNTTAAGTWTIAGGKTTGTWYHLLVTHDSSSTSNNPAIYINGVLQTVTEQAAPSGGLPASSTSSVYWGNRSIGQRGVDGRIERATQWKAILTADDADALYKGVSPQLIRPDAIASYMEMRNLSSGAFDPFAGQGTLSAGVAGSTLAPAPLIRPSAQILQFPPTAAAGGGGNSIDPNGVTSNWNGLSSYSWNGV